MKPTAGNAKLRRTVPRPRPGPSQKQLNLQRRPRPEPEDDVDSQKRSGFWKWVLIVTLLHAVAISIFYIVQAIMNAETPAPVMFSLLPPGDTVKGTAGQQSAKKVGQSTPAPKHSAAQPPATTPPPQKTIPPKTELKIDKPTLLTDKPPVKPPPKPKEPKVKVDLHLADGPPVDQPKPAKTKTKIKKPAEKSDSDDESDRETDGLSKEEIAAKLGAKSETEGTRNAKKIGTFGAPNGTNNDFSAYYALIAEQVHDEWNSPVAASGVQTKPIISIHIERSGRIPPESVHLVRSSGDSAYDAAAVDSVQHIGMLREPLPAGCPADVSLSFNPNP